MIIISTNNLFDNVKIIDWSKDISINPHYKEALSNIRSVYHSDSNFRYAVDTMTKQVLVFNGGSEDIECIQQGVHFLLKELAFIMYSDLILNHKRTIYLYHKTMGLLRDIIYDKYSIKSSPNTGFLTVN